MLKSKLAPETLRHVKARADFFFTEQCKRLGPIIAPLPVLAVAPIKRPRKPRKVTP